ncbi:GGDEF domain-containing protein [uncultured Cohaesibacter sp.]|uniref:GGDEF domain-containing protein n=1 Tax=uncultured Cohaesibacter sp. TaxID=1002546 RepID=UPI0029C78C5F|nr:GGDEF domain-containing protein [uncultured Cohaesibacter sp.]
MSLHTVFEEMSDGVIIVDLAGKVCYRNKVINDLPGGLENRILSYCAANKCGCELSEPDFLLKKAEMGGWSVSCHPFGENRLLLVKYDNHLGRRIQLIREDFSKCISDGIAPATAAIETMRKHIDARWVALGAFEMGSHSIHFEHVYDGMDAAPGRLPVLRCRDDFMPCEGLLISKDLESHLLNSDEVVDLGLTHIVGMSLKNHNRECVGYVLIGDEEPPLDLEASIALLQELSLLYGLYVEVGSARTEARKANADANTDVITDQGNRRAFEAYIKECLDDMLHEQEEAEDLSMFDLNAMRNSALMIVDFDGFKRINDLLGHSEGDRALRLVAQALGQMPVDNHVFRLGGDEFAQVFPRAGNLEAEDLRQYVNAIERDMADEGFTELGLSIGVVHFFECDGSLASLMALADARMYHDKRLRTLAFL